MKTMAGGASPADLGLLILRLAVAVVFVAHGYLKVLGGHLDRTIALFLTVGIPAAETMAGVVGTIELLGGLAVATGVWARPAAAALGAVMLVAITRVRIPQGFLGGWEFEFVVLGACLALAVAGPGRMRLGRTRGAHREDSTT